VSLLDTKIKTDLVITKHDFDRFRDFFYRKTGIFFEDSKRYFVDKRLINRIKKTDHLKFRDYFVFLRFETDGKELQELINCMTVNETYFFRESYQFDCMVNHALDEILEHKCDGETLKIWSLPSSTGEEAYSIAIYLMEYWPQIENVDVEIYASDIDSSVLAKAREGIYNQRSVAELPKHLLAKYFKPLSNNRYQAIKDLRDCVEFCPVNIMEDKQMKSFRNFDLVYCRNMLIYFDDTSRRLAAEAIYDALNPGGILFLGHSESMSRISSLFKVKKFSESIGYQKALR
jgi:chemotaxis protein methyltransferase CheR